MLVCSSVFLVNIYVTVGIGSKMIIDFCIVVYELAISTLVKYSTAKALDKDDIIR